LFPFTTLFRSISRITGDVSLLQDTFSVTLAELFRQMVTLLAGTVFLIITTPKLTLFMLATFPVLVVIAMIFGRFIRKLSRATQDEDRKSTRLNSSHVKISY